MNAPAKQRRRGLVVGKFCPLHRGHMLVIDSALAACDDVIVISYTKPEFAGCGRALREAWLRALYPQVRVLVLDDASLASLQGGTTVVQVPHNDAPDAVQRDFCGWLCMDVLGVTVDAVFTSEDYGDGFARALSGYFDARRGPGAPVQHVSVDRARALVPVSGTAIRADPHAMRAFLHPLVYASFVRKVCLLGGESSGKTTLAAALAQQLDSVWAPEFGRELWLEKDGALVFDDMLVIGHAQLARERALLRHATRWLVCDTSPLTTLFYSDAMFGRTDPALHELAAQPYDVTLLCAPDFAFVQDGTRRDDGFRQRQHAWYVDELTRRGVPFTVVHGTGAQRLIQACARLAAI
ncbi:AAA family ATPase [Massilia pseudoviolaceinigra]|uniref:AAA family ATPase n=1 Tax=Massilia pseudoviolaceinigra TaxID=3057165 RepID=UPI002796C8F1|nr:AAA family ATPase [Massilia sp. CCM 9206]MDQ1923096.1 AAA family ATPase [Massilia sp. CCM 9206]